MAWRARVVKKTLQHADFVLTVEFFDDADPASVLLREDMSFPAGMTRPEILAAVRARGVRERAARTVVRSTADLVDQGDEVPI